MNISIEKKKAEAIARMKKIGIFPGAIRQFAEEGIISESIPPAGACFLIEGEQLKHIREFEKKHDALVYFVIHGYTKTDEMESYLYPGFSNT